MKYLAVLFVVFVSAKASIIGVAPLAASSIIKGASASGAAIGADGAVVTAVDGATIVGTAPRAAVASAVVAPGIVAAAAPALVAPAPLFVSHGARAVIAGPSGTVVTNNGIGLGVAPIVAAPAVAASAIVAPAVAHAAVYPRHGLIL